MLDIDSWKFILEARIERENPYTCLTPTATKRPNIGLFMHKNVHLS